MKSIIISLILIFAGFNVSMADEVIDSYSPREGIKALVARNSQGDTGAWYRQQLRILRRAHKEAQRHLIYGNYEGSVKALMRGIEISLQNIKPYYSHTFTSKAIHRVSEVTHVIMDNASANLQVEKALNYFLFEAYRFITFASVELDSKITKYGDCYDCELEESLQLEKNQAKFAKWQLDMMISKLTTSSMDGDSGHAIYHPMGPPELLLVTFVMFVEFTITDLMDSIFASRFACVIDELQYIKGRLNNASSEFPDSYEAFQFAAHSIHEVSHNFLSCGVEPGDFPEETPDGSDDLPPEDLVPTEPGDFPEETPDGSDDLPPKDLVPTEPGDFPEETPDGSDDLPPEDLVPTEPGDFPEETPDGSDDLPPEDLVPTEPGDSPEETPDDADDLPPEDLVPTEPGESPEETPDDADDLPPEDIPDEGEDEDMTPEEPGKGGHHHDGHYHESDDGHHHHDHSFEGGHHEHDGRHHDHHLRIFNIFEGDMNLFRGTTHSFTLGRVMPIKKVIVDIRSMWFGKNAIAIDVVVNGVVVETLTKAGSHQVFVNNMAAEVMLVSRGQMAGLRHMEIMTYH